MTLMSLQRREVTSDAEFNDLVRCKWASFDTPHNGFHKLFWPIRGTGPTAREDSIQESIGRQIRWHRADPSSHWIKVVDTDLDMVVGGAQWIVYESNPYVEAKTNRGKISADWWPEGEGREFAEAALWMWIAPRIERMRRPHLRMFPLI